MSPEDFIGTVKGFEAKQITDQVTSFAWYLTTHAGKSSFQAADITRCYVESRLRAPTSIPQVIVKLSENKQPSLIRVATGRYTLARSSKDALDKKWGVSQASVAVVSTLKELPDTLSSEFEKEYLREALACFQCGAFRAAIVMTWNMAYDHLCCVIMDKHLSDFNQQLPITFSKKNVKAIVDREGFNEFKESEVIQVAKSAGIISSNTARLLSEKLTRRNMAAHPSGVKVWQQTAEEFILDLVRNVIPSL